MINDTKAQKPTIKQSFADLTVSARAVLLKLSPRFGYIYFVLMLLGITSVVYIVSQTMQSTSIGEGVSTSQKLSEYTITLDQSTISQVKALSNNNSSPSVTLPTGRINPFAE